LLENGANPFIKNEFGISAKDLVKNNAALVKIIDDYAANTIEAPHANSQLANESEPNDFMRSQFSQAQNTTIDLNTSIGQKRGRARGGAKTILRKALLFGTGMSDSDKTKLNSLASKLSINVGKEMTDHGNERK
jgi:hypothetical protein